MVMHLGIPAFIALQSILFGIATLFITARIFFEVPIVVRRTWSDKPNVVSLSCAVFAWLLYIIEYAAMIYIGHRGLDAPKSYIHESKMLKASTINELCYILTICLVKASFIAMYYERYIYERMTRRLQYFLYFTTVYTALTSAAFFIISTLWCRPFGRHWSSDITQICQEGIDSSWFAVAMSLSVTSYILILAVPLWVLKTVKVQDRDKMALAFPLILGALTILVSFIRAIILSQTIFRTSQASLTAPETYLAWVTMHLETACVIIAVSLPSLRAFVHRKRGGGRYPRSAGTSASGMFIMKRVSFEVQSQTAIMGIEEEPEGNYVGSSSKATAKYKATRL